MNENQSPKRPSKNPNVPSAPKKDPKYMYITPEKKEELKNGFAIVYNTIIATGNNT